MLVWAHKILILNETTTTNTTSSSSSISSKLRKLLSPSEAAGTTATTTTEEKEGTTGEEAEAEAAPHTAAPVRRLQIRGVALLSVYALQFLGGGLGHEWFHTLASRNTLAFRILWTAVTSCVCLSGAIIGSIASELTDLLKMTMTNTTAATTNKKPTKTFPLARALH